jgi:two-component system, sporulation sensor kinase E
MPGSKSAFIDKLLGRMVRLDKAGLQTVVERLARDRRFLETLFNTIEDGLLVVDEGGNIAYVNEAATRLLGIPAEGAEGQPVARHLPQLDWGQIIRLDRKGGRASIRHEFEVTYPRARFLRLFATPLDGEAAGSAGVALIIHDATEYRQQTSEAIQSERIHALTLLAASVAHEIGNPLNALHIHLQLLERELKRLNSMSGMRPSGRSRGRATSGEIIAEISGISGRLEEYLRVAKGEVVRLDYIITEFLQALRPKPPAFELASINDVARETLALLAPELANRGLRVHEKLFPNLPKCMCDPGQIKQVLVNLIKNAMQSMTKGGILTIATGTTAEDVSISVIDTGSGIAPEQQRKIFEPFYTTKEKGSGLGLMIVERIIRNHGGRIQLLSQVGHGTTFRIALPLPGRGPKLIEAKTGPVE